MAYNVHGQVTAFQLRHLSVTRQNVSSMNYKRLQLSEPTRRILSHLAQGAVPRTRNHRFKHHLAAEKPSNKSRQIAGSPGQLPSQPTSKEQPYLSYTTEEKTALHNEFSNLQGSHSSQSFPHVDTLQSKSQTGAIVESLTARQHYPPWWSPLRWVKTTVAPISQNTPAYRGRVRRYMEIFYLDQQRAFLQRAASDGNVQEARTSYSQLDDYVALINRYIKLLNGQRAPRGSIFVGQRAPTNLYRPEPVVRVSMEEMDAWRDLHSRYQNLRAAVKTELPSEDRR